MIAKCIDDKSEEYPNFRGKLSQNKVTGLTKDKLYEAEQSKQYDDYFEVINDLEVKESYKKERFEVMECINKDCSFNIDDSCRHKIITNTCVECDKRIKPEQIKQKIMKALEVKKEEQPIPINYEEEYKKLKEENEDLRERLDNQAESIGSYIKENEKYIDYIKDSNKVFDKLTKENEKLEKEVEEGYQCVENEYENKLFLAEQKATETINELKKENEKIIKEKELLESQLENELGRNKILKEKFDTLDSTSCQLFVENNDLTKEINQLRDDVQKANFKLKEYDSKLPQLKELVVKLIRINEILASNIYVEGLED